MTSIPDALFVPDGDRFVATEHTHGPWSEDHQHAGPPAALIARALEALAGEMSILARRSGVRARAVPEADRHVRVGRLGLRREPNARERVDDAAHRRRHDVVR